jgi:heme/copper-type cytochrome/quinol oxidase subunit 3
MASRVPAPAWFFVVLAAACAWLLIGVGRFSPASSSSAYLVVTVLRTLAWLLLPVALLVRHPNVPRQAPLLTLGVVLLGVGAAIEVIGAFVLLGLWPVAAWPNGTPAVVSVLLAYPTTVQLLNAGGLLGVGIGLARARQSAAGQGSRWTVVILVLAILLVLNRVAEVSRTFVGGVSASYGGLPFVLVSLAGAVLAIAAWTYLTIVCLRGVRAHERPLTGWRLALASGSLHLAALGSYPILTVFVLPELDLSGVLTLTGAFFAIGPVALFLAFVAGVPSAEPPADSAS